MRDGAVVTALLLAQLYLVFPQRGLNLWTDEGLSVGIGSHPLRQLPTVLRQDGNPPLWFALVHVWLRLGATTEAQLHLLPALFAALSVPLAYALARSLGGRGAGLAAAALVAADPFVVRYATELRMYTLVLAGSLLTAAGFAHAFVLGRRRWLAAFAGGLGLLLWTHTWAVFGGLTWAAAVLVLVVVAPPDRRRPLLRDALIGFGAAGASFLPWLPTLLYQAGHTGAPWASVPSLTSLESGADDLVGGFVPAVVLLVPLLVVLGQVVRRARNDDDRVVLALLGGAAGPVLVGWAFSQVHPAFAPRYLAVALGPLVLALALVVVRAGGTGIVTLAFALLLWVPPLQVTPGHRRFLPRDLKSNVADVVSLSAGRVGPGDLALVTQPEVVPVLAHYLPKGVRYETTIGPVTDPDVMDWRDALPRLRRGPDAAAVVALVAAQPSGTDVLVVSPHPGIPPNRNEYNSLILTKSTAWVPALLARTDLVEVTVLDPSNDRESGWLLRRR